MISSYFIAPKFNLDQIAPIIDPEDFKYKTQDFWYLKRYDYQNFAFIDDVFCEDQLDQIIRFGNLYAEELARVGGNVSQVNSDVRMCKLSGMFANKHTEWIYRKITDAVNQINDQFFQFDLTKLETFQFTKYKEEDNGFYEKHIDPISGTNVPENRKLSLILQLSDSGDYEGGDLCLYTGKEPTIIEKKRGRIIFFPSYTLHEVKPVTKGTRYTLVGWVHGPAFK
jgi:PKHD-type hydroxylase